MNRDIFKAIADLIRSAINVFMGLQTKTPNVIAGQNITVRQIVFKYMRMLTEYDQNNKYIMVKQMGFK